MSGCFRLMTLKFYLRIIYPMHDTTYGCLSTFRRQLINEDQLFASGDCLEVARSRSCHTSSPIIISSWLNYTAPNLQNSSQPKEDWPEIVIVHEPFHDNDDDEIES